MSAAHPSPGPRSSSDALAAWGIVELRGTRLDKKKAEAAKKYEQS